MCISGSGGGARGMVVCLPGMWYAHGSVARIGGRRLTRSGAAAGARGSTSRSRSRSAVAARFSHWSPRPPRPRLVCPPREPVACVRSRLRAYEHPVRCCALPRVSRNVRLIRLFLEPASIIRSDFSVWNSRADIENDRRPGNVFLNEFYTFGNGSTIAIPACT